MSIVLWVLVGILVVVAILLSVLVYLRRFDRKAVGRILEEKVRKLQDEEAKVEEELELRKMKKELESSIADKKKQINALKE